MNGNACEQVSIGKATQLLQTHIQAAAQDVSPVDLEPNLETAAPLASASLTVPAGWCASTFGISAPGAKFGNVAADWVLAAVSCQIRLAGLPATLLSLGASTVEAADSRWACLMGI